MTALLRCGVALAVLFLASPGGTDDKPAAGPLAKSAMEGLLTRLDKINRDPAMTSAKKALVSANEIDKFHQQYPGACSRSGSRSRTSLPRPRDTILRRADPDLALVQCPPCGSGSTCLAPS